MRHLKGSKNADKMLLYHIYLRNGRSRENFSRHPNLKNRFDEDIEKAVIAFAIDKPVYGGSE
jgi:hypothetical protein